MPESRLLKNQPHALGQLARQDQAGRQIDKHLQVKVSKKVWVWIGVVVVGRGGGIGRQQAGYKVQRLVNGLA